MDGESINEVKCSISTPAIRQISSMFYLNDATKSLCVSALGLI